MFGFLPWLGRFQLGRQQTTGTPLTALIPPMKGCYTHITKLALAAGSTAHTCWLLRPLNYTTLSAAAAAGQAVVNLTADPSAWNTTYQYPLLNSGPNGVVPSPLPAFQTANGSLTAGDYLVFETADGAFFTQTIASVLGLAVTLAGNVPTGGLMTGARVWYMGQGTTSYKDPATGLDQFNFTTTVSTLNTMPAVGDGDSQDFMQSLHPYDPILFYDPNATATDTLDRLEGFYLKY